MFPKQNILYFILREKEKIYQIHYSIAHRQLVTKFLGVYLDEIISWKHHIDIVTTRNCKSIGILYRTSHIMNKFLRKYLYFFFNKLLLKLHKCSMGQGKQKQTARSLSPSETCSKDHKF